jgi:type IX secretion system PorP/SprF family membrane protein
MRKLYLFVLVVVSTYITAQDAQFNQPNFFLTRLNPSFAGTNGGFRLQTAYQNLPGYTLSGISADVYLPQLKGGLSFSAFEDAQNHGTYKGSYFGIGYAQHFNALDGDLKIIPSVQFNLIQQSLDVYALNFGSLIDPRTRQISTVATSFSPIPWARKSGADLNSGLMVQYKNSITAGFSVFHVNQPDIGLYGSSKLKACLKVHGAYTFHFSEKQNLQLMSVFTSQGTDQFIQVNGTLVLNRLIVGLGTNSSPAPMGLLGYRGNFITAQLSYCVDYNGFISGNQKMLEAHLSANIRGKEHRRSLTNIENW